jgi:hypothetical protein
VRPPKRSSGLPEASRARRSWLHPFPSLGNKGETKGKKKEREEVKKKAKSKGKERKGNGVKGIEKKKEN